MPVQRCTLTLPIPLIPIRTVQPVQNLSACTTVHFTFTYTCSPPIGHTACTEPQCLYNGALYLYLYSTYGPYSLYRASVPVQRCTLPLPIPLLPLRTVQNLSSCTTVHFILPIALLLLWTVQPVQSLSSCRTVHFTFTYSSTPPTDRIACTEPQFLCNVALYLTYTSTPPMDCTACTEPQSLYSGAI